jgi:ABC-type multidrug transport system fused ATPase/permease subunit
MVCEAYEKKNKVLVNSIENQKLLIDLAEEKIIKSIREVQKRDDVIERKDSEFEMLQTLNADLKSELQKEKFKKSLNKYIYLGIGLAGGYFIASGVRN